MDQLAYVKLMQQHKAITSQMIAKADTVELVELIRQQVETHFHILDLILNEHRETLASLVPTKEVANG